ncbi:MAG: FGGY-family carbohydrate kinase, partial [Gammaproteobacteria bacterium]|nr:FGGY-family carbohydrate kinase [Gammaproteobacteria bacterium]
LGTSGVRAIAIDSAGRIRAETAITLPAPLHHGAAIEQQPVLWWEAVAKALDELTTRLDPATICAIAVDGTSGTVLLADGQGTPLTAGIMYNDGRALAQAARIAKLAPRDSAAHGSGSGLAKVLWLLEQWVPPTTHAHTQADWIAARLGARPGICDANNALKLGYDPLARRWPAWLETLQLPDGLMPKVVPAGRAIGTLAPALAQRWGIFREARIISGTTDSTAAFLASGAVQPGEAVTALGSTLVLKVIAERPVFAPEYGVYSHPFGNYWLVGGASNSGGAVLRQFFSDTQMAALSLQLDPDHPTGLDYYPLTSAGERFPLCDPQRPPRVTPRPEDDAQFFQGLLEGIAHIERAGYERLAELGAPYPTSVRSNGAGAANAAWTAIRALMLGVPLLPATHTEAAYGSALLAREGYSAV